MRSNVCKRKKASKPKNTASPGGGATRFLWLRRRSPNLPKRPAINLISTLNDKLFQETYDLLYDKDEHLFARDAGYLINENGEGKREANGKKVFWSRGNGWVLGGLARLLNELPKDYPKRAFYENLYKEMAAKIITLQQPDGLWRSSLLDPDSLSGRRSERLGILYLRVWRGELIIKCSIKTNICRQSKKAGRV